MACVKALQQWYILNAGLSTYMQQGVIFAVNRLHKMMSKLTTTLEQLRSAVNIACLQDFAKSVQHHCARVMTHGSFATVLSSVSRVGN